MSTFIKKKLETIIKDIQEIYPIGNHELKRHYVYKVVTEREIYVVKLYDVKDRWNSEVKSLQILEDTMVMSPQIVDYGIFEDNQEWLIYKYEEGDILQGIMSEITEENLIDLYTKIGEELGKIHSSFDLDIYGRVSELDRDVKKYITYRAYTESEILRIENNLEEFTHEEIELIEEAKKKLKENLFILDGICKSNLCHNDFNTRNILVEEKDGKYILKMVIDFEQSTFGDRDKELLEVFNELQGMTEKVAKAFEEGYTRYLSIDKVRIERKRYIYNLLSGLQICGWSKDVARDHYQEGLDLIKDTLKRNL